LVQILLINFIPFDYTDSLAAVSQRTCHEHGRGGNTRVEKPRRLSRSPARPCGSLDNKICASYYAGRPLHPAQLQARRSDAKACKGPEISHNLPCALRRCGPANFCAFTFQSKVCHRIHVQSMHALQTLIRCFLSHNVTWAIQDAVWTLAFNEMCRTHVLPLVCTRFARLVDSSNIDEGAFHLLSQQSG
jgi:hypothetical protein